MIADTLQRVSTKRQTAEEKTGLARQDQNITNWLQNNAAYKVRESFSVSDSSFQREDSTKKTFHEKGEFKSYLDDLRSGRLTPPDVLIVDDFTRLSRLPLRKARNLIEELSNMGITIVTASDNTMYKPDMHDTIEGLLGLVFRLDNAHKDSLRKSNHIRSAKKQRHDRAVQEQTRVSNGGYPSWLIIEKDKEPELKPFAEITIKTIVRMYLNDRSMGDISKHLNDTKNGQFWRQGEWTVGRLSRLLGQPALTGVHQSRTWKANGERFETYNPRNEGGMVIQGVYPELVTKQDFDLIQAKRAKNKSNMPFNKGKRSQQSRGKLLFPKCTCVECGSNYTIKSNKDPFKSEFICVHRKDGGKCSSPSMNYYLAETMLVRLIFKDNDLSSLFDTQKDNSALESEVNTLAIELNELKKYMDSQARVSVVLLKQYNEIENELADKRELLAKEQQQTVNSYDEIRTWSNIWEAEIEERNKVRMFLDSIVESIEITSVKRGIKMIRVLLDINGNKRVIIATSKGTKTKEGYNINIIDGVYEGVEP